MMMDMRIRMMRSNLIGIHDAIMSASKSKHPRHRHSAIIFYQGEIVCIANNTHHEHAEVRAVNVANVLGYKKNLTLISVAIDKAGKLKLAKPCMGCNVYISVRGVDTIYYSTREQRIVKL